MRGLVKLVVVLTWVLIPTAAYAQASIAGVVRDTSGAVLPGVTVEAASPALIRHFRPIRDLAIRVGRVTVLGADIRSGNPDDHDEGSCNR